MRPLLAFIFGCLTTRILLALAVKYAPNRFLPYIGLILLGQAIGFSVIYVLKWRRVGPETGGKRIWWDHMRPIHGSVYFLAAVLALGRSPYAYVPLAADVVLGMAASYAHYAM